MDIKRGLIKSIGSSALESIILTVVIDAYEERNIMACNIPNAFIKALCSLGEDKESTLHGSTENHLRSSISRCSPIIYGTRNSKRNWK